MMQTAEAPIGVILYSDAIETEIAGLKAERDHYHELYYKAHQELSYVYDLFEVSQETLTASHKASVLATVRYLRAHADERNEQGYIKMETWQVASLAKQGDGTLRKNWEALSRELRVRDGQEIETDVGNVPIFDRLVIRIPTDDRERFPQGYYLETWMKERDITYHPERYRPQTPIEWGGKRKDAGRRKCKRCDVYMRAKDHIRTAQREHICPKCHRHEWDETRTVSAEMPPTPDNDDAVNAPVERPEASKNQVEFCYPEHLDNAAIEASKPVLDEVYAPPLLHQVAIPVIPPAFTQVSGPPEALRSLPIWCPWRYEQPEKPRADGKLDKVPYRTYGRSPQRAKTNDDATWSTCDEALAAVERSRRDGWKKPYEGVGWMCNGDFTGLDLDHCINEQGEISDQALDCVALFGSYTYITPSHAGLRIVIRAKKPGDRCRWPGVEIYNQGRFFTWTPDHLDGTPEEIADGQAELDALYKELVPDVQAIPKNPPGGNFTRSSSDDEILEKARNAPNGAKFTALWSGSTAGYDSQSEADLALCRMLAYWADGDVSTIDRLFQHSDLMRDKWHEQRGAQTYGELTIARALGQQERRAS